MKRIYPFLPVAACVLLAASACSNSKSDSTQAQIEAIDVSQFTGSNAVSSSRTIDSLALQADFLTPDQSVGVLVGLSEIVKNKQGNERYEYMRKFVDTYDIISSRGDEFAQALSSSKSSTGIDLPAMFAQYRDVLNDEADDGTTFEDGDQGATNVPTQKESPAETKTEETPAPADSVK